ncbi:MAG: hypothetical protein E7091_05885 [Bacteroidales bacterium]|nr:hypothetical protein [Bacteroidales bacterium]
MTQDIIVVAVFIVCALLAICRLIRMFARFNKGGSGCDTCVEVSCPLRQSRKHDRKSGAVPCRDYRKGTDCGCGCGK